MYSTILRLVLKGVPLFAAVLTVLLYPLFGVAVVWGRLLNKPDWFEGSFWGEDFERQFFHYWLFVFACGCFIMFVFCAALILAPARQERLRVAQQLRTFDVCKAQAWSAADKEYLLEKVRSWYGSSDRRGEAAVKWFNHFVRTDVATCLGWKQRRREAVVAIFILLVSFILWCGLVFAFSIFVSGTIEPLGWPTIKVDLLTWAVPDHCFLANPWIRDHCNTTSGAGYHEWVRDAPCFNGTLIDAPAQVPEGCVASSFGSGRFGTWYVSADAQQVFWTTYAAMLCYSLAVCCYTVGWARPETRPYAYLPSVRGSVSVPSTSPTSSTVCINLTS